MGTVSSKDGLVVKPLSRIRPASMAQSYACQAGDKVARLIPAYIIIILLAIFMETVHEIFFRWAFVSFWQKNLHKHWITT